MTSAVKKRKRKCECRMCSDERTRLLGIEPLPWPFVAKNRKFFRAQAAIHRRGTRMTSAVQLASVEMNGLRVREVVLDWYLPSGQAFVFKNMLWKSPQDATPDELATCRRMNERRA